MISKLNSKLQYQIKIGKLSIHSLCEIFLLSYTQQPSPHSHTYQVCPPPPSHSPGTHCPPSHSSPQVCTSPEQSLPPLAGAGGSQDLVLVVLQSILQLQGDQALHPPAEKGVLQVLHLYQLTTNPAEDEWLQLLVHVPLHGASHTHAVLAAYLATIVV